VPGGAWAAVAHGQAHPVTGPDQWMLAVGPVTLVADASKRGIDRLSDLVQEVARGGGWRGHDAGRVRLGVGRVDSDLLSLCPLVGWRPSTRCRSALGAAIRPFIRCNR
jgi:hypothetical protein